MFPLQGGKLLVTQTIIQVKEEVLAWCEQIDFLLTGQFFGQVLVKGIPATLFTFEDMVDGAVSFQVRVDASPEVKAGFGFTVSAGGIASAQIVFLVSVTPASRVIAVPHLNRGGAVPKVHMAC